MWSLSSVDFHTLTLQLPIQTPNSVAPELQAFVSSLAISAKRAHPWHLSCVRKVCGVGDFLAIDSVIVKQRCRVHAEDTEFQVINLLIFILK